MRPHEIAKHYESETLGSFSTKLMDLFSVADTRNSKRLASAFPEHYEAYCLLYRKSEGWDKPPQEKL